MPLIERPHTGGTQSAAPDPAYAEVRQSFFARLHSEQARLEFLSAALESAGADAAAAFGDLEKFAHRLRGAAAVFDVPGVREGSKALELAAAAAIDRRAPGKEPFVRHAIRTLATRLIAMNGGTVPVAVAPVSTN